MNKIEEVARALIERFLANLEDKGEIEEEYLRFLGAEREGVPNLYGDAARASDRATLLGIREPTIQHLSDGVNFTIDANLDSSDGVGPADVEQIWHQQIDNLLEGK